MNIRLPQNGDSKNQQVSKIEYALSISMAKELSMIENNERGKQARKYFIACEENKHELSRKDLALMVLQAEEEKNDWLWKCRKGRGKAGYHRGNKTCRGFYRMCKECFYQYSCP